MDWSIADPGRDADAFDEFTCWNDDDNTPWVAEVQHYVRNWVLRQIKHVVAGKDDAGDLTVVSAFDERVIRVPLLNPTDHPGWHLHVLAVRLDLQRNRLFDEAILATFATMRQIDPNRALVTAHVHKDNGPSLTACARHGLDVVAPLDDDYFVVLGEVPTALDSES